MKLNINAKEFDALDRIRDRWPGYARQGLFEVTRLRGGNLLAILGVQSSAISYEINVSGRITTGYSREVPVWDRH